MKAAIVTGASSGIGFEISKVLLDDGYLVYGIGRDFTKLNYKNSNFKEVICDMTKTDNIITCIRKIKKESEIHILVNNAGVGYFGLHEELNPKKIHEMVSVNLESPLIITNMLLRDLKRNKGTIINISSITAVKSSPHGCAYAATKAGLTHFSESLFDEVRKTGVKVVVIHPDMVKTKFYRNADFREDDEKDTYTDAQTVAQAVKFILEIKDNAVITDITLRPQKHRIRKKDI